MGKRSHTIDKRTQTKLLEISLENESIVEVESELELGRFNHEAVCQVPETTVRHEGKRDNIICFQRHWESYNGLEMYFERKSIR